MHKADFANDIIRSLPEDKAFIVYDAFSIANAFDRLKEIDNKENQARTKFDEGVIDEEKLNGRLRHYNKRRIGEIDIINDMIYDIYDVVAESLCKS